MKHLLTPILLMLGAIAFCASCSSNSDEGGDDKPKSYQRSVIFYLAAQNSLGAAGAARLDSAEIAAGASILTNSNDNAFLFLDDARKPRLYRMYKYKGRTFCDKIIAWPDDACSTDPATLKYVLSMVALKYPSQSYGLVMWSHGDGWLTASNTQNTLKSKPYSFGIDVGPAGDMQNDTDANGVTGPMMNISDMARAISQSGIKMDYIFFDACLMQNIEVAYELKDVTKYVIGSAISTSAYGGYYVSLIPKALYAYPANDANVSLIASQYYYDAAENPNLKKYYGSNGSVISVIKTEALDQLATTTGSLISKHLAGKKTPALNNVQAYCSSAYFDSPDFFDMGSVMHQMLTEEEYKEWRAIADKVVIHHQASDKFIISGSAFSPLYGQIIDPDHNLGVTMYVPRTKFSKPPYSPFNKQFQSTRWYKDANWASTGW